MRNEHLKWAFSYLIVNLVGTLGFLCAVAMIYGGTGHLNIAALAALLGNEGAQPLVTGWAYLILGIFGLKAGLFPLYFWLPTTYASLPPSLVALFSGSLTKIGVYILIRIFVILLPGPLAGINELVLILSCLTILFGALGAISSVTIRGILSYHIVSQIGYMTLSLALYTPLALASAIIFIIHNIWVKVSLFLIGGIAKQSFKTDVVQKMGDLSSAMPWLAAAFLIQAFSLAGFPPLSGFWGKYFIVAETFRTEYYVAAGLALFTSWLTLFSMIKIWIGVFWKNAGKASAEKIGNLRERSTSIFLLVSASLLLGLGIQPVYEMATLASAQLFQKEVYIHAVLQKGGKGIE
jgi:multicomponent Na+:H+ antiporter subunit D